jgi:hypothetical protein
MKKRREMQIAATVVVCILLPFSAWCEDFASASSIRRTEHLPFYAMDGDEDTRWSSDTEQGIEWLQIDLGRVASIEGMQIRWENAFAAGYTIEVSMEGETWTRIHRETDGQGGTEILENLQGRGRYVKFLFTDHGYYSLYSIWELKFLNPDAADALQAQVRRIEEEHHRAMIIQQKRLRKELAEEGIEEIIFVTRTFYQDPHWYANISYFAPDENRETYAKGAGLYKLHVPTGAVSPLLEDPEGSLRDPAVHYDGKTILFSWRKGGTKDFHLYTMQSDGSALNQLTDGAYDDIEPAWLPDGGIAFVSTRSRRWVNCWYTKVATVHRSDGDGANIRPLSANLEHDNTPWPMADGRVLYTRWEYIDRSQMEYHHLWIMNPDGTNQTVFYGNLNPGGVFIDAKPIPETNEVLFIESPLHGRREHEGYMTIVDVQQGPDHLPAKHVLNKGIFVDPYPITPNLFMAGQRNTIVFTNRAGELSYLHKMDKAERPRSLHEPRPLVARSRETVVPSRVDYEEETGQLILANVHEGRNMEGVEAGDITRLLVVESLPKPINFSGGMEPITMGGSFTLERIWGSVPVESDGSAYMELPANRALFFIAQDDQGDTVKRMQSFLTVMPGETTSCVGCHEQRTSTLLQADQTALKALQRPPSAIRPIPDIPEVFDFPRDIQPILDEHCLPCHDYIAHGDKGPRAGGLSLSGDHGPVYSHSYAALTVRGQIADGRNQVKSNRAPRTIGAVASPLIQKVRQGHQDVELSKTEQDLLCYWIEAGAPYPGTYAALGSGSIGIMYGDGALESDEEWPEAVAAAQAIETRCNPCHVGMKRIPRTLTDAVLPPLEGDADDVPPPFRNRNFIFNLSRPELSLVLLEPLAKSAGGYGLCLDNGAPVFANTDDPAYQAILALCQAGKNRLQTIKRFDMPGFRPNEPYIREMKHYKVLPNDLAKDAPVDPYATDQRYWDSFGQASTRKHPAYAKAKERP